ncbi:helix-turn-helix domain-containing protein, partial [Patescibacteria group bacterium]|nr:helix-turn-helix domain-containing protein [Patescibacteria group bacterium]
MEEITIEDKIYISSKQAAKITGYAKDYVGQLCREGRVEARLVGRSWYVLEDSIKEHRFGPKEQEEEPVEVVQDQRNDVTQTWKRPEYASMEPVTVPEFAQKQP